ncbi:hypothetical protein J2X31_003283 [Flavobacterium arsenatis]|uniref:Lipoprotein n=1 Tax=Flavobacterium arsenatis TaxID=1484332 RepID=A0ABU1TTQ5_9FLAO|nr:hypothetical protein [Flavobacterium arsenatis]MDR6969256.1 hypothetical protein [Flavobacterium arsenatis]
MKHYTLLIIGSVLLILNSCKSYDYSINSLKKDVIKFDELPIEVQKYLINPSGYSLDSSDSSNFGVYYFICLDSVCVYEAETITTKIGPWVDYIKLKDNKNNISYKIDQGRPTPYIVFDKKLYLSQDFNPLSKVKTSKDMFFYCYYLKK